MTIFEINHRVLFLDFDGVLHPLSPDLIMDSNLPLSELIAVHDFFRWVPLLADILRDHADVRIVVHSIWRLLATDAELRVALGPLTERFAGSTPRGPRWESIAWVITQNRLRNFRILDDSAEDFPPALPELILCDENEGIADALVQTRIREWLTS